MNYSQHNALAGFIWNIADDVLRDVYVRGKYRDVILPMTVIRRLDALLEPTKEAVLRMKEHLDAAKVANQDAALSKEAGQAFYNSSPLTLRRLLDNHSMGTVFEELIRRFNEENNEEAGEHFTPRDVVRLMANLIFLPQIDESETKIGYELSFTRYFYKPQPLRTFAEIKAEILAVESEGLLESILGGESPT